MLHQRRGGHDTTYESIPILSEQRELEGASASSYDNDKCRRSTGSNSRLLVLSGICCLLGSTMLWRWWWNLPVHQHHLPHRGHGADVTPTYLSVKTQTGAFLNALDNELYDLLKRTKKSLDWFRYVADQKDEKSTSRVENPKLVLDQTEIDVRGALTLSWTDGSDAQGRPIVQEDDLLLLQCGNMNEFEMPDGSILTSTSPDKLHILDVATIAHVRATAATTSSIDSSTKIRRLGDQIDPVNEWKFNEFPVVRQDVCQFVLYRMANNNELQILAQSEWVHIRASHSKPTAIHWAVTANDPTAMVVQFVTGGTSGTPVIQYSAAQGSRWSTSSKKITGTTTTYTASDLCSAPANLTEPGKFQSPGQLHTIKVTDLTPDTAYQYQVGLTGGNGVTWSDAFTIRSPPKSHHDETFSYIVYGDQGCPSNGWGEGSVYITAMCAREIEDSSTSGRLIRAIHHIGDLSYARGAAHIWDEWLTMIQPVTTRVPLMVSVGNHEYDYLESHAPGLDPSGAEDGYHPIWGNFYNDSGGECGVPTSKRFAMPQSEGSNGVFWYSYDMGPVHTTVFSSEHDLSPGSTQYEWLANDLKMVNRTKTPWLVVEAHRPMYHGEAIWEYNAVGIAMRMEFEDLLHDYQVDLFLSGHYHSYFRTCDGLYRSRCQNGGPTHITVGSAGAQLNTVGLYWNWWTAKSIRGVYGYGRISVANSTALHFEFVKAGDANDTTAGDTLDNVWIVRSR